MIPVQQIIAHIRLRRGPRSRWAENNPVLKDGEAGYEQDHGRLKIGDGATPWSGLPYIAGQNGEAEARLEAHANNAVIHVTQKDRDKWNDPGTLPAFKSEPDLRAWVEAARFGDEALWWGDDFAYYPRVVGSSPVNLRRGDVVKRSSAQDSIYREENILLDGLIATGSDETFGRHYFDATVLWLGAGGYQHNYGYPVIRHGEVVHKGQVLGNVFSEWELVTV